MGSITGRKKRMKIDCELYNSFGGAPPPYCPRGDDCSHCRNPLKAADVARPDKEREQGRGKGNQYKQVVNASEVLFEPEKVIEDFKAKAKIEKEALFRLLKTAVASWNELKSIDQLIHDAGYGKEIRLLVAHCIITLNEMRYLFGAKWYTHYEKNINTIDTYLDKGIYHEQVVNTYSRSSLKAPNRKPSIEKIIEDAFEFLDYLKSHYADIDKVRDGEFYNIKGFRCLLMLVDEVRDVIGDELKSREPNAFSCILPIITPGGPDISSVDEVIHASMWQSRTHYYVLYGKTPVVTLNASITMGTPELPE